MPLVAGTRLGPYDILAPLGTGGMGVVYQARDPRLDRLVAIKVLPPDLTRDAGAKQRFLLEAKAASALDHPNICTIHEIGETPDGELYLVMACYDGETLKQKIARGPLAIQEAFEVASQVAQGLSKAHDAGIIHRDIKPANLMVTPGGTVKILDFGLAKLAGAEGVTQTGTTVGTVAYMSPEQARGEEVDRRSDIWSLGVVLYEMLAGMPPFAGDNLLAISRAILDADPRPLPGLASGAQGMVSRALSKGREHRYQSVTDLLGELQTATRAATQGVPSQQAVPFIAVLPFTNMSPDPENEYFSDGLTEEIIADLSKIRALRVISRTSSMRLKGTDKDLRTIGRELNVRYLLEGSVRKSGNSLRITAQLIDAADDVHLWAEKYHGTMDDVFAIQETLSRKIVEALKVTLTAEEDVRIAARPIDNIEAYECYLRARHAYTRFTLEGVEQGLRHLDEGLSIVGPNALLYGAKGHAYFILGSIDTHRHREHLKTCRVLAEKIFDLEPDSAQGYALLGLVEFDLFETVRGLRHMTRALELAPNDLDNLTFLSLCNAIAGQDLGAEGAAQVLIERDPLNPFAKFVAGLCHLFGARLDRAESLFREALSLDPQVPNSRTGWAQSLVAQGKHREAIEVLAAFEERLPTHPWTVLGLILRHALDGDRERALGLISEELCEAVSTDMLYAWMLAERYALSGETHDALRFLETAIEGGFWNYEFLGSDPLLAGLRTEPEYGRLIALARDKREQLKGT